MSDQLNGWLLRKMKKLTFKSHLVAQGFEEINKENIRTDSPICSKENFRLIFSIIVSNKWNVKSLDVKSVFVQGQPINRDVFLRPTKKAGTKTYGSF